MIRRLIVSALLLAGASPAPGQWVTPEALSHLPSVANEAGLPACDADHDRQTRFAEAEGTICVCRSLSWTCIGATDPSFSSITTGTNTTATMTVGSGSQILPGGGTVASSEMDHNGDGSAHIWMDGDVQLNLNATAESDPTTGAHIELNGLTGAGLINLRAALRMYYSGHSMAWDIDNLGLNEGTMLSWSSTNDWGNIDLAFTRIGASTLRLDDGSTGTADFDLSGDLLLTSWVVSHHNNGVSIMKGAEGVNISSSSNDFSVTVSDGFPEVCLMMENASSTNPIFAQCDDKDSGMGRDTVTGGVSFIDESVEVAQAYYTGTEAVFDIKERLRLVGGEMLDLGSTIEIYAYNSGEMRMRFGGADKLRFGQSWLMPVGAAAGARLNWSGVSMTLPGVYPNALDEDSGFVSDGTDTIGVRVGAVNALVVDNTGTDTVVTTTGTERLEPRASCAASCTLGDRCIDDSGALCYCDAGNSWVMHLDLSNGGSPNCT